MDLLIGGYKADETSLEFSFGLGKVEISEPVRFCCISSSNESIHFWRQIGTIFDGLFKPGPFLFWIPASLRGIGSSLPLMVRRRRICFKDLNRLAVS